MLDYVSLRLRDLGLEEYGIVVHYDCEAKYYTSLVAMPEVSWQNCPEADA